MWAFSLAIWLIAGIIMFINCRRGIEADWPSYWLCYGVLITTLLALVF